MPQLQYQRVQAAIPQVDLAGLAPTMLAFMKANVATNALVFVDQHGVMSKPGCRPPMRLRRGSRAPSRRSGAAACRKLSLRHVLCSVPPTRLPGG